VGKMDATKNTVASVEISVFPTLKLFAKDTNKMVDFSGEFFFFLLKYRFHETIGKTFAPLGEITIMLDFE
jgi:hypothetical protein